MFSKLLVLSLAFCSVAFPYHRPRKKQMSAGVNPTTIQSINGDKTARQVFITGTAATAYITSNGSGVTTFFSPTGGGGGGSGITDLTGDGTATGPGSAALTLATVNSNVGTFSPSSVTVNGKGLVTAASSLTTTGSGSVVLNNAPTITGTAAMVSLTASGFVKAGSCHLEPNEVDIGNSGTSQTFDLSAHNVFTTTLNNSPTITLSNPQAGCPYVFSFTQDVSGNKTITFSGVTVIWVGGTSTLTTTGNALDLVNCVYMGSISSLSCALNANVH